MPDRFRLQPGDSVLDGAVDRGHVDELLQLFTTAAGAAALAAASFATAGAPAPAAAPWRSCSASAVL